MEEEIDYYHLIERTLSGNQEAYSELYDITIQDVYKTAHFLIEEKTDVDDVVQEIYIQLYQSLSKYNREKPFKPWLIGLAIRQMKKVSMELQPYFDKLNGDKSSKEELTSEEYEQYIDSLMTYEKVQVKIKSSGHVTVEEVPEAYKEEFVRADRFMEYVNGKVQQMN